MDFLKKLFPFSFNVENKNTSSLISSIVVYVIGIVAISVISALLGWILSNIPVLPWLVGTLAGLLNTYCTAGVVLAILKYFNVLK